MGSCSGVEPSSLVVGLVFGGATEKMVAISVGIEGEGRGFQFYFSGLQ